MGEVRTKVEDKSTKGMVPRLKEIKEELYDMLTTKTADLKKEPGLRDRNEKSITALGQAISGVNLSITALDAY